MAVCIKIPCNIKQLRENRMFHARDCKTGQLFDKWAHMGPKRRKLLDDSWAGLFRREILPELPVEKLATAFDEINGRPTKEMYTTLGALIFQQMLAHIAIGHQQDSILMLEGLEIAKHR